MILSIDVGNSHVFGGVFEGDKLGLRFRKVTQAGASSDELGLFLTGVLRENKLNPEDVRQIGICSVVPPVMHSIRGACVKYFGLRPFVLQPGARSGLSIRYKNPLELGSDRIANAIAAIHRFPGENLIIVSFGTATTYCVVSSKREHLGGLIMPGLKTSMEALENRTARLPSVEIVKPEMIVGRSTTECIQSGLYFGALGAARDLIPKIKQELFADEPVRVVATGGFSRLFEGESLFDVIEPDLIHYGIRQALLMNL